MIVLHVIYFMCRINEQTSARLREVCLQAINVGKAPELIVHMSSVGGGLHEGFTLYHFFRSLPVRVTMTNAGSIESAAVLAYLGGAHRLVSPMARFVFHPWTWDFGAGPRHIPIIKEALHSLEADMERFVQMVDAATKGAKKPFDVRSSYSAAKTIDAGAAIEHGISHEIKESITPQGATQMWING